MIFLISVLCILLCYWFFQDIRKGKYRPPGPLRLPLLGNMVQIGRAHPIFSHRAFDKLSQTYGGLTWLKVGLQDVVVVSDFSIMRDMLTKEVFLGRHGEGYIKERSFNKSLGVIFTSEDQWRTMRTFTVKTLKDFGFGRKQSMETTIANELPEFIKYLKGSIPKNSSNNNNNNNSSINCLHINRLFHLTLLNILWSMVGGKTFSHDDPKLLRLLKINEDVMRSGNFGANLAFAFPFLTSVLPSLIGLTLQRKANGTFQEFIRIIFDEARRDGTYLTQPSSFIDICLAEMDKNADKRNSYYTEEQFIITIIDLFQTGSETTGNTLCYALLFMVLHPEVQEKVFQEISSHFPNGTLPSYDEITKLPYTVATILEVMRASEVVPVPPPRKAVADVMYRGFYFPKDTIVTMNFYSVLTDKQFWGDPQNFRPERFLEPDAGPRRERIESLFGFGKRICLGEKLAQTSIFLYFTAFIQNFRLEMTNPEEPPSLEPLPGFILSPQPFTVQIWPRIIKNDDDDDDE